MQANMTLVVPDQVSSLTDLANHIRAAHASVIRAFCDAIDYALMAGRALNAAKSKVPHGEWLPFLQCCDLNDRTAQRYMQLTKLADANPSCTTDLVGLSIEAAIERLLSLSKPPTRAPEHSKAGKPVKPATSSETGHTDIIAAWITAPSSERTRALDGIGLASLLAAMPSDWWPLIEQHIAERCPTPVLTIDATAPRENLSNPVPDDLSIPRVLRRELLPSSVDITSEIPNTSVDAHEFEKDKERAEPKQKCGCKCKIIEHTARIDDALRGASSDLERQGAYQ
jgi:hypothetical protein